MLRSIHVRFQFGESVSLLSSVHFRIPNCGVRSGFSGCASMDQQHAGRAVNESEIERHGFIGVLGEHAPIR